MDSEKQTAMLVSLQQTFTPSFPINSKDFFAGRTSQMNSTASAIVEFGQHAILYGERGVGKTSLSNIIPYFLDALSKVSESNDGQEVEGFRLLPSKVTCNRNDSFESCWKKALSQIKIRTEKRQPEMGFSSEENTTSESIVEEVSLAQYLPTDTRSITIEDVTNILSKLPKATLFIFDEFDSISSREIKQKFADIIKTLSDTIPHITILLVGIGESVSDLIGEHASLERCFKQILLPRMEYAELQQIIENGQKTLEMDVEKDVKEKIVGFSQGFPHYTHLLCKYSFEKAIYDARYLVTKDDFDHAVNQALENIQESIRQDYQRAVMTVRKEGRFKDVVAACALVDEDEYGTFRLTDLQKPLKLLTGQDYGTQAYQYHVGKLCQEERGAILKKVGSPQNYRYRFRKPMLKAYVTLRLYQDGGLRKGQGPDT